MSRLIYVPVAAELVAQVMTPQPRHRTVRCERGLPEGATLRSAEVRWLNGGWELLLGFECPGDDGHPETINPSFAEYYGKDPDRAAGLIPDEDR